MATYTFGNYTVSLASDSETPFGEIEDLHICPLGMRFISRREIAEFGVFEFDMAMRPQAGEGESVKVACTGVVVESKPEGGGFRTIIHFLDLCKEDSSCLAEITRENHMRCEYCENC